MRILPELPDKSDASNQFRTDFLLAMIDIREQRVKSLEPEPKEIIKRWRLTEEVVKRLLR